MLDVSPVEVQGRGSDISTLVEHLRNVDITKYQSRREVDVLLQDKIPVSLFLWIRHHLHYNITNEPFQSTTLRDFLLTNLTVEPETKVLKWRVNLQALYEATPYLAQFPDVGGAVYSGPTLFLGGEQSSMIG